jgi:hypothetical protein
MTNLRMQTCSQCGTWFLPTDQGSLCDECVVIEEEKRPRAVAYERGWYDGYACGWRVCMREHPHQTPNPPAPAAPAKRDLLPISDLIKLCHPDRHPAERVALANRVTQILLEIRKAETT